MTNAARTAVPAIDSTHAEVALPMLSALVLGSARPAAILYAFAAGCLFAATSPLRDAMELHEVRRNRAIGAFFIDQARMLVTIALGVGTAATALGPVSSGVGAAVPVISGIATMLLVMAGRAGGVGTCLVGTLAMASAAVPVALAAGLSVPATLALVLVWFAVFAAGNTFARGVTVGHPTRGTALGFESVASLAVTVGVASRALARVTPEWPALAGGCGILALFALVLYPPPDAWLRRLGPR